MGNNRTDELEGLALAIRRAVLGITNWANNQPNIPPSDDLQRSLITLARYIEQEFCEKEKEA
jgi:hypothetical protein